MTADGVPIRRTVGNYQPSSHADRIPPPFTRNPRRQPLFVIELAHQLIDVDYRYLELDYKQGPGRWMPGKDVDHTTLAINRVRHFGRDNPAGLLE
jgi:hypothetical protein